MVTFTYITNENTNYDLACGFSWKTSFYYTREANLL